MESHEPSRKTRAIMFSDIQGYSKMMGKDETLAMQLLEEHNAICTPLIEQNGGTVLKFIGDAILSSFESASDAVHCGMEIQRALAARNSARMKSEHIVVRIGIHIGDVVMKDGDVLGDGVNIAARIEPLAEPGGIAISQTVYDMIHARPEIQTVNLGPKELKNIKDAINIYKVVVGAHEVGWDSSMRNWLLMGAGIAAVLVVGIFAMRYVKEGLANPTSKSTGSPTSGQAGGGFISRVTSRFSRGPANLLTNPDFEQGMTGWKAGGSGTAMVFSKPNDAHVGSNFAELASGPGQGARLDAVDSAGEYRFLPVKFGDVVTFGAWAYRGSGDGKARCTIGAVDDNKANPRYISTSPDNINSAAWGVLQGSYIVSPWRKFIRFYCELLNNQSNSLARFDDVFLRIEHGPADPSKFRPIPETLALAGSGANPAAPARTPETSPGQAATALEVAAGIEWVPIPAGSFMMGSEVEGGRGMPVHRVSVKAFEMAKAPVTFKQYRACVAAGVCNPPHVSDGKCGFLHWQDSLLKVIVSDAFQGDQQPVVCVDWDEANTFARWVGARLPTEAEWEYAARSGGKDRKYPWGNDDPACGKAVVDQGGPGCGRNTTWPVCSKPGGNTEQGLCDMAGNVWEWVQDRQHDSYNGAPTDGSAWDPGGSGGGRVCRGGAWHRSAGENRTTYRGNAGANDPRAEMGFRLVRVR